MRSRSDRIRHALSFELLGLALVTPLGAWAFDRDMHEIGLVALVCATVATGWNYVYNLLFDLWMSRRYGHTRKSVLLRVGHAVLFELGLLVALAPYIAWELGVSLGHALVMDMGFAGFYLVYAFVFNWLYDLVFPIPQARAEARG
ncbi:MULTISPECIES: PACE efflux transporter [Roseobacteraceae]|uniref:PACE efflux transporter n=1 Tax=Roseobacteraceae TaxID=2854170 RepID=UPI0013B75D73|nr:MULTISPECIES: PACE efflux transporter [unclassified Salipiger]NDV52440.1 PACE efflux transporter [Salipiger sp. PrR003]NDW30825.1 PACE efflux transporter [Salipiger sp. PrR007]